MAERAREENYVADRNSSDYLSLPEYYICGSFILYLSAHILSVFRTVRPISV